MAPWTGRHSERKELADGVCHHGRREGRHRVEHRRGTSGGRICPDAAGGRRRGGRWGVGQRARVVASADGSVGGDSRWDGNACVVAALDGVRCVAGDNGQGHAAAAGVRGSSAPLRNRTHDRQGGDAQRAPSGADARRGAVAWRRRSHGDGDGHDALLRHRHPPAPMDHERKTRSWSSLPASPAPPCCTTGFRDACGCEGGPGSRCTCAGRR